jgi:hypothetical protein
VCFITAGPITKLCACGGDCVCFITAGPITKLFAWGGRRVEDMSYERRRAEVCVDESAHHTLCDFVSVQFMVT